MRAWLMFFCLLLAWPVAAKTVEVVGTAPIEGSLNYAREQAFKDAMQQALLENGAQVSSLQLLSQGQMAQDEVSVSTQGEVTDVKILWEDQEEGYYRVAIQADVRITRSMCGKSNKVYRKTLAVSGFVLAHREQASLGRLYNVEQNLPRVLFNSFNEGGAVQALDASNVTLYDNPRQAPSSLNAQRYLTNSISVAKNMGAQFLLSGVVRDMSVLEDSTKVSWKRRLGLRTQAPRQLVLDVFVHDGLSGSLIFQRSYSALGDFPTHTAANIGFATPEFWTTGYGENVREMLVEVMEEVGELIRCQPFMTRIVKVQGNQLYLDAGSSAGLRPGDKLKVYRTGTFYHQDILPHVELTNMATEVTIKSVQPQFAIAEMNKSAGIYAIQRDDMLIAW